MKELFDRIAKASARTLSAEHRILDRAMEREQEVAARLDALRPSAQVDDDPGQEYQALVVERAKLAQVIELSKVCLAA